MGGTSGMPGPGATLSTLANYPKAKINKLISESRPLIGGARKCKQIWHAIKKADFRKEGNINETNLKLVFESCKQIVSYKQFPYLFYSDFRLDQDIVTPRVP
jgi:hypothetical protein